jgi:pimeloyl-ACP methyl ester carboxylesterase
MARRARAIFSVDATEALRGCPVPVLYLRATEDRLVLDKSVRAIRAASPDVTVVDLPAPHLLLQTRPEEAWQAIEGFLASVSGRGSPATT